MYKAQRIKLQPQVTSALAMHLAHPIATIQNAFIDISDSAYSTIVYPLFQSQSSFTNLKIQFGTQSLNSGSLLLSSSSVSINQMNIISRFGSQLTVNSAKCLNIVTSTSSSINIANLLVNLSYAPSNGNITLINNINGVFNVSGYQVLGTYTSTGTVAMIGLNINSATANVNQVSFQPTAFNVGNGSSYLFGNATTTSTIKINNFAVIIGSISSFYLLGSISSTSLSSNYYQFGGIIASVNGNSVLIVNNVILDSYQKFSTNYTSYSGFLIGYNINSNQSIITIQNVCLQQNMTSTTLQFLYVGLIGANLGNTSIQKLIQLTQLLLLLIQFKSVCFSVQGAYINSFGIIGYQQSGSINANITNLITLVNVNSMSGGYIGTIFGTEIALNCLVQNVNVVETNINSGSTSYVSSFFGLLYKNTTIMNSSIKQTNISSSSYIGGFVGWCNSNSSLYLINSKIQFMRFLGSNIGIVVGYGSGIIYFTGSSSTQIYVNGVLRSDCAVLSNWNGC
ncbi:Hypothetical_protein [Hexamita inflata]|uniref:Hypothetical_protein n=1 Tax=Hexamita inflata TaxID=28002 RepID=A0AA86PZY7_9EUKA|nr:Hypothetical protein HINF_LOCUS31552 [Hexamita inflata]